MIKKLFLQTLANTQSSSLTLPLSSFVPRWNSVLCTCLLVFLVFIILSKMVKEKQGR